MRGRSTVAMRIKDQKKIRESHPARLILEDGADPQG